MFISRKELRDLWQKITQLEESANAALGRLSRRIDGLEREIRTLSPEKAEAREAFDKARAEFMKKRLAAIEAKPYAPWAWTKTVPAKPEAAEKPAAPKPETPLLSEFAETDTLERYKRWIRAAKEIQNVVLSLERPAGAAPPAEEAAAWVSGRGELDRIGAEYAPRFLSFLKGRPGGECVLSHWTSRSVFIEKVRRERRSDSKRLHRYVLADLRTVLTAIETHITDNPDSFREFIDKEAGRADH